MMSIRFLVPVLAAASVPLLPAVAGAAGSAESAGGLPQLDAATFPAQLFWFAVSFTVLYFVIAKIMIPRVVRLIKDREERISISVEQADQLRRDAEDLAASLDRQVVEAREQAKKMVADAYKDPSPQSAAPNA